MIQASKTKHAFTVDVEDWLPTARQRHALSAGPDRGGTPRVGEAQAAEGHEIGCHGHGRGITTMIKNGMRPVPPGEILREDFLVPLGTNANALAKALNVLPRASTTSFGSGTGPRDMGRTRRCFLAGGRRDAADGAISREIASGHLSPRGLRSDGRLSYRSPGRTVNRCEKSESRVSASEIPSFSIKTKLRQSTALYFLSW